MPAVEKGLMLTHIRLDNTIRLNTVDELIARTHSHTHIYWHNTLAQYIALSLRAPLPAAAGSHTTCSEAGGQIELFPFKETLKELQIKHRLITPFTFPTSIKCLQ